MIGNVGTAVPDTAASYTKPRGRGGGHGCARHRGVIPPGPAAISKLIPEGVIRTSTLLRVRAASREGAGTAVPDAEAIIHPRPTLIAKAERDLPAHNRVWRQKGEG